MPRTPGATGVDATPTLAGLEDWDDLPPLPAVRYGPHVRLLDAGMYRLLDYAIRAGWHVQSAATTPDGTVGEWRFRQGGYPLGDPAMDTFCYPETVTVDGVPVRAWNVEDWDWSTKE